MRTTLRRAGTWSGISLTVPPIMCNGPQQQGHATFSTSIRLSSRSRCTGKLGRSTLALRADVFEDGGFASALCMKPKIMLYDEPTSSHGPDTVKEVLDTMVEFATDGMTMICVTPGRHQAMRHLSGSSIYLETDFRCLMFNATGFWIGNRLRALSSARRRRPRSACLRRCRRHP
jgi:ABC-type arginine transport system ATPase subunit